MHIKEMSSSSESEEGVQGNEADCDTLDLMRKELSEVPFEDLHKLKQKVGSKVYDKALFGGKKEVGSTHTAQDARRIQFRRANKNRPQETSSKIRVRRCRNVVEVQKKVSRDPRFDDLSGTFNEAAYESNYAFMVGVYDREKKEVSRQLKQAKTEERKTELQRLLQRMEQQEKARIKKQVLKDRHKEQKKQEKHLVKRGKKPFFLKKSEQKKVELANHYSKLKQSGKLDKYISRKRKKNASKDRRHIPGVHSQQR